MLNRRGWVKTLPYLGLTILLSCIPNSFADLTAHDYSVELVANVVEDPPSITLQWLPDPNAIGFQIARKVLGDPTWSFVASVDGSQTSWSDDSAQIGTAYEYQVIKATSLGYTGYGYICSAIRRSPVENRGKIIFLVEGDLATALPSELARLQQDLAGDGWTVIRQDVSKSIGVNSVKDYVKSVYQADPSQIKALFLFGHIPVPYSGDINPDNHDDDIGAWPADVYYGEFDGAWTDSTVNETTGHNPNIPGDGKFDQSVPPGPVRLQIGRVDLSNLTCFSNKNPPRYELDLARQYLEKDHNFRTGVLDVQRRGLVFGPSYRGLEPEPQLSAAWRSFPSFFGRDQIRVIGPNEYFPILDADSYLWSYVVSGGSAYGSDYIGTSDSWAVNEPKVVFTSFLGSYFGDWDQESDFLRAPLGTSQYTLTCIFSGQPPWILHTMAMGEPIGAAALLTQNNPPGGIYPPQVDAGAGQVHIALMGDPTLRMHPVKPPTHLNGVVGASGVTLTWNSSPDSSISGYYVYWSGADDQSFARISGANPIAQLSFTDTSGNAQGRYMVRALKLEQTPAGSYYNLSQGAFFPDATVAAEPPQAPHDLTIASIVQGGVVLRWINSSGEATAIEIQRRALPSGSFVKIGEAAGAASTFQDANVSAGQYGYRVRAVAGNGTSNFSNEALINLQQPSVMTALTDVATGGNWIGAYGRDGYIVPGVATNVPTYANFASDNVAVWVWSWDASDPSALLRPDSSGRIMTGFYNVRVNPSLISCRFADSTKRRITFYMADFDHAGRSAKIEAIDSLTARVLDSITLTNYEKGEYVSLDVRNYVDIRITPATNAGENEIVAGIFFDSPQLSAPVLSPANGSFLGKTTVSMSASPGATIFFTTDGSDPNPTSPVYNGPFELMTDAVIKAKAIQQGFEDSLVSTLSLTNTLQNAFVFVGVDNATQGDWKNLYGETGQTIPGLAPNLSSDVEASPGADSAWTWSATTEQRAVNTYFGRRIASAWYGPSECVFDVIVYSSQLREIALYFLDWDNQGRVEDLSIIDGAGRTVLQRRIDDFYNGQYVVFRGNGSFHISLKNVAGPNALLNGVFFGEDVPMSVQPPHLAPRFDISSELSSFRIEGAPGQVFDIQSSADLRTWTIIGRVSLTTATADFIAPIDAAAGGKFYRAALVP